MVSDLSWYSELHANDVDLHKTKNHTKQIHKHIEQLPKLTKAKTKK